MSTHEDFPTEELLAQTPYIQALAARLAKDWERDDLVQEAWLKALRQPPKHRRNLRSWFASVLRHRATDEGRRAAAQERRVEKLAPGDDPATPPELLERTEAHRAVVACLRDLDEPYRHVLLLHYFEGLTLAQIGERLGMPKATAGSRLHRGTSRLRQLMVARHGRDAFALCVGAAGSLSADLAPGATGLAHAAPGAGGAGASSSASPFGPFAIGAIGFVVLAIAAIFLLPNFGDPFGPQATAAGPAASAPLPAPTPTSTAVAGGAAEREESAAFAEEPLIDQGEMVVIRGRCVDATTGAPLTGFAVELDWWQANDELVALHHREDWEGPDPAPVDGEGDFVFRFEENLGMQFAMNAVPPGYAPRTGRWSAYDGMEAGTVIELGDIPFTPGHTVSGKVVDRAGQPVADTLVSLEDLPLPIDPDMAANDTRSGTSDADGNFTIDVPIPPGTYPLDVREYRGYALEAERTITVGPNGLTEPLIVRVKEIPSISGRVVDPDGNGIGHVDVNAEDPDLTGSVRKGMSSWTRDDGFFRIYRRAVSAGTVFLSIDHGETAPWESDRRYDWETHGLTIVVERTPSMDVVVRDAGTGEPIEDFAVITHPMTEGRWRHSGPQHGGTHEQGELTVDPVPLGPFQICIVPRGRTYGPSDWVEVADARALENALAFELSPRPTATVAVRDAEGKAVVGSRVQVIVLTDEREFEANDHVPRTPRPGGSGYSGARWLADEAETEDSGHATVHWRPEARLALLVTGDHRARVLQPWTPEPGGTTTVTLEAAVPVRARLLKPSAWPTTKLLISRAGVPSWEGRLPDAEIHLEGTDWSAPLPLEPGSYQAQFISLTRQAEAFDGAQRQRYTFWPKRAPFEAVAGEEVELEIDPSPYAPVVVHGTLRVDGTPARGGFLAFHIAPDADPNDPNAISLTNPDAPPSSGRVGGCVVAEDGSFRAKDLAPVPMRAIYLPPDGPDARPLGAPCAETIAATPGAELAVDLSTQLRGLRISFLDASGRPLGREQVRLYASNATGPGGFGSPFSSGEVTTDAAGRLELPAVRDLDHSFHVRGHRFDPVRPDPGRRWTEITLRLPGED